jgi:hypothetical protein
MGKFDVIMNAILEIDGVGVDQAKIATRKIFHEIERTDLRMIRAGMDALENNGNDPVYAADAILCYKAMIKEAGKE